MSYWILIGSVIGIVIATTALLVGFFVVPPIIVQQITENVQLVEGTDQYERWVTLPQPLEFKVYIFNVTNVEEIQRGMMPKLEEIGPYVYLQNRKKFNIRFTRDRERVSYFSQQTYTFDREKSYPLTEDDNIKVLNMHMNSILQTVERETPFFMPIVNDQLSGIFGPVTSFFIDTSPRKFLFEGMEFCKSPTGLPEIICNSVLERQSPSITKSQDGTALVFSMFAHKNRTHDGLYEINTGIRRLNRLLQIERWNSARTIHDWNVEKNGSPSVCQFINGTDATTAGAFREEGDSFYIFASDICRSVQLKWDKHTSYAGIDAFRYSTRENFLNDLDECFCINEIPNALKDGRGCLLRGALDLSQCIDAPVVATMPHFFEADPRYNLMVEGLNPNAEAHSMYMDVEPNTGTPLRGGKKLQFNMFLKKIEAIQLTAQFNTTRLFPVLWVEEGLELNEEMTQIIKDDLVNVLLLVDILQWTIFGVGIAMFIGFLIWFFIARSRTSRSTSIDPINPK